MAKFLLDEQISPRVAQQAQRRGIDVIAIAGSPHATSDDLSVLHTAIAAGRILVTYDVADFTLLLADASRAYRRVPGVVFVDARTLPTSDIGGLVRALVRVARRIDAGEIDAAGGVFVVRGR